MHQFVAAPTDLLRPRPERREDGRSRRARAPRSSHAEQIAPPDRPDPVALLAEQHTARLPDLVPVRVARMAESPFAFLRGSAIVMAADLAATPTSGLTVQACGDAHLANFGGFASPERREVFDLNDFDETLVGPWEWDVKRLAASAMVAARDLGMGDEVGRAAVRSAIGAYRDAMRSAAELPVLDLWYAQVEIERDLLPRLSGRARRTTEQALEKMRRRNSQQMLPKLTELTDAGPRIIENPPLVTHEGMTVEETEAAAGFVHRYMETLPEERHVLLKRFRFVDAARKVVGVGSVGTRCFVVLLMAPDGEPLFLQIKEAPPSVLETWCGPFDGSGGKRVVVGQREIQTASDVFLGWADLPGHDFYIRQLRDMKVSADLTRVRPEGLSTYLRICGAVLARAHARTGDPVAISGYLGSGEVFVDAISAWAEAYADQTAADHARLLAAVAAGELPMATA